MSKPLIYNCNWDPLRPKLNSNCTLWCCGKKKKKKKVKAHRVADSKEPKDVYINSDLKHCSQKTSYSSCVKKETVDMHILITSRMVTVKLCRLLE